MNRVKRLDVETCINGLKWIVFEALMDETSEFEDSKYATLLPIRENRGIKDRLRSPEDEHDFDHMLVSRLLESLLHEGFVETLFMNTRRYWKVNLEGVLEYQSRLCQVEKFELDAYINGLEEIVLDVLEKTGKNGEYLRLRDIAGETGIEDELVRVEGLPDLSNGFTNTILMSLLRENRVHKHPTRRGAWRIADSEMRRRLQ